MLRILYVLLGLSVIFFACGEKYTPEQREYIKKIENIREDKNKEFQSAPYSPFVQDTAANFSPLKYFPVNPNFAFVSKLKDYQPKDTVIVLGTKGEERKVIRYGFLTFRHEGKEYRLNIYQGKSKSGEDYHSIWFTDLTTGNETYGVGRYIDFEINPDKNFEYTIDFNLAYNPYCAYSSKYSCAVPTKDDFLEMKVLAGEKIFHE
jgi:hypothetical protein